MPRATHHSGGTEWIKRHRRSLIGSVSGGAGVVGILAFAPDYVKVRDTAAANATHLQEVDRQLLEAKEARSKQWERISTLQLEVERLKAGKQDR